MRSPADPNLRDRAKADLKEFYDDLFVTDLRKELGGALAAARDAETAAISVRRTLRDVQDEVADTRAQAFKNGELLSERMEELLRRLDDVIGLAHSGGPATVPGQSGSPDSAERSLARKGDVERVGAVIERTRDFVRRFAVAQAVGWSILVLWIALK